jgi:hypothetical protein
MKYLSCQKRSGVGRNRYCAEWSQIRRNALRLLTPYKQG